MSMRFEGIYTPVITPMGPDREIDEEGWVEVIEHLIGQGMHGLVLGGTTGENYALTTEERLRQFRYGDEVIARRVPWIAGVNDIRTEDVSAYAVAAREAGASAILLAVPPYSIPHDKELAQHALAVDKACGLPVITTSSGGPLDIVSKDTGWLFKAGDVHALAKRLTKVLQIDDLSYYSEMAKVKADNFSVQKIGDQTMRFYEAVIRERENIS